MHLTNIKEVYSVNITWSNIKKVDFVNITWNDFRNMTIRNEDL